MMSSAVGVESWVKLLLKSESYLPERILCSSIMSPLNLWYVMVDNFNLWRRSWYDRSISLGDIFVARRWTFSKASVCFFRCGLQIWFANSRCGQHESFAELTEVVNTNVREVSSDSSKDPVCCVNLFVKEFVSSICGFMQFNKVWLVSLGTTNVTSG